jgi:hypothetical protein
MLLDKNSGGAETVESSAVLGCTRITYMSVSYKKITYMSDKCGKFICSPLWNHATIAI